ncbi:transcription factor [Mactra antiquata]
MLGTLVLASVLSLGLCAGGWSDVPQAEWSTYETTLQGLNDGTLFGQNCVTTKIETQVVAGLNIRYTKHCGHTSCTITVWQKVWENFVQVTDNQCAAGNKRQMPGGYSEVTNQAQITQYETMLSSLQTNGDLTLATQFSINKIEQQVVAGLNIKFHLTVHNQDCTIVVYYVQWEHTESITHNDCPAHKRQAAGSYHVETDQAEITKYETWLSDLESNGDVTLPHYTVTQIETQVVAGLNVKYTLTTGHHTCTIIVYDVPWTNSRTITTNTCSNLRRQLLGGFNSVDVNKPDVQNCLGMGLDGINAQVNSMYRMVDSKIIKAEQQVVAGMNYAITFEIEPSTCMNSGDSTGFTSTDCPLNANMNVTPDTWNVRCFMSLQGSMSVSHLGRAQHV